MNRRRFLSALAALIPVACLGDSVTGPRERPRVVMRPGDILTRCPVTRVVIGTGMHMDAATWQSASLGTNYVGCPECGRVHGWNRLNAWRVP